MALGRFSPGCNCCDSEPVPDAELIWTMTGWQDCAADCGASPSCNGYNYTLFNRTVTLTTDDTDANTLATRLTVTADDECSAATFFDRTAIWQMRVNTSLYEIRLLVNETFSNIFTYGTLNDDTSYVDLLWSLTSSATCGSGCSGNFSNIYHTITYKINGVTQ